MNDLGKISNAYTDEIFRLINTEPNLLTSPSLDHGSALKFIFKNLKLCSEIDDVEREINMVLDRLGLSSSGMLKIYSIDELVLGVKHYLIAWSTLKDMMASLINNSLDLGIHENDLSLGMILRNQKVKSTNIPDICSKKSKPINVSYTDKQRNDAIHRGKLLDNEINEFRAKKNDLFGKRYGLLSTDKITEDEFNNELKKINTELAELVTFKKEEYKKHFQNSIDLNVELAIELAKLAVASIKNNYAT